MAKKKQKTEQTTNPTTEPSTPAALSTSTPSSSDAEAKAIERAFDLGNFSRARALVAAASGDEAKKAGARLMPRMNVEREQIYVGLVGLVVVLIACAVVLTRG